MTESKTITQKDIREALQYLTAKGELIRQLPAELAPRDRSASAKWAMCVNPGELDSSASMAIPEP